MDSMVILKKKKHDRMRFSVKNSFKTSVVILQLLATANSFAQVQFNPPPRQVIASSGNYSTASWGSISATVGETIIETFGPATNITITQGFQQPSSSITLGLSLTDVETNLSCNGADDGTATITVLSGSAPFTYVWTPNVSSTNFADSLAPGTYTYTVTDNNGFTITDSVRILDNNTECGSLLGIYNGITPNGDGNNDDWIIDGIQFFPENTVSIFNRWGDLVWKGENYDNTNVVWKGTNQNGADLPSATYFYVIEIPDRDTEKGWVELTK